MVNGGIITSCIVARRTVIVCVQLRVFGAPVQALLYLSATVNVRVITIVPQLPFIWIASDTVTSIWPQLSLTVGKPVYSRMRLSSGLMFTRVPLRSVM